MKRFLGALLASIAGILTFVFLSIPCMSLNTDNETATELSATTGWDILSVESDSYTLVKVFIIIMIILACLLILVAILSLLKETNIIKSNINFNMISFLLLVLLTISAVVVLIGIGNIDKSEFLGETIQPYKAGIGAILNVVVSGIATLLSLFTLGGSNTKKKRR